MQRCSLCLQKKKNMNRDYKTVVGLRFDGGSRKREEKIWQSQELVSFDCY